VAWEWSFGDGVTSTEANPTHSYSRVATFTARLTVTDDRGGKATASASVKIKPVPPDTVTIYRCDYTKSTKLLAVTASSTNGAASLSVDGQGAMTFDRNSGRWSLSKSLSKMPARVKVVSTRNGYESKTVKAL
jgi:PKD repeat protein